MFFIPIESTTTPTPNWRTTLDWRGTTPSSRETTPSSHKTPSWHGTTPSWRGTTPSWRRTTQSSRRGTTRSWRVTTRSWCRRTTRSLHLETTRYPSRSCYNWEFQCRNGQCVNGYVVCDGAFDCRDGSDEAWFNCES